MDLFHLFIYLYHLFNYTIYLFIPFIYITYFIPYNCTTFSYTNFYHLLLTLIHITWLSKLAVNISLDVGG